MPPAYLPNMQNGGRYGRGTDTYGGSIGFTPEMLARGATVSRQNQARFQLLGDSLKGGTPTTTAMAGVVPTGQERQAAVAAALDPNWKAGMAGHNQNPVDGSQVAPATVPGAPAASPIELQFPQYAPERDQNAPGFQATNVPTSLNDFSQWLNNVMGQQFPYAGAGSGSGGLAALIPGPTN